MFLAKSDLFPIILEDELTEITRSDDVLITSSLSTAIAEMKTYLNDSYDIDAIFNSTGTDRHALLVQLGADIAVYYLVARVQAGQDVEDRRRRYDRAIAWLKMANKTKTYPDLPHRENTVQTHIYHGSNKKRSNYY